MLIDIFLTIILLILLLIFGILSIILLPIGYLIRVINKNFSIIYASTIVSFMFSLIKLVLLIKIDVHYEVPLDKNETYMYISNHRGDFDVILTYPILNKGTFIIAKNSLKKIPILKHWMELIDCYFLDRNDLRDGFNMVLSSIDKINKKHSMLVYPEGTRSKGENVLDLLEFKDGVFSIAKKTKIKIVPIAIKDTSYIFEKNKFLKTRVNIFIKVGAPEDIEKINEIGKHFSEKIKLLLKA